MFSATDRLAGEVDLLVDGRDPRRLGLRRIVDLKWLAAQKDVARIDSVDASQRLDQGGLAGTVLAEESVHLAREQAERDVVERDGPRET